MHKSHIKNVCTGQFSAVTFCAKHAQKPPSKNYSVSRALCARKARRIIKALKAIGVIVVALIGAWYLLEDCWYRKAIPENIGLSYRISITSDSGLREGCGTAVYKLDIKTAEAIKEQGVKFFEESGQARGHSDRYYTYGEWMETPRDDWSRPENWSYELLCGGSIGGSLYDDIVESGRTGGSYYSFKDEAVLMVIPDKKLVVFSHNG